MITKTAIKRQEFIDAIDIFKHCDYNNLCPRMWYNACSDSLTVITRGDANWQALFDNMCFDGTRQCNSPENLFIDDVDELLENTGCGYSRAKGLVATQLRKQVNEHIAELSETA